MHTHIGGVRGKILERMHDYLKDREMRTVMSFKLEKCNNYSAAGVSLSTNNVPGICK